MPSLYLVALCLISAVIAYWILTPALFSRPKMLNVALALAFAVVLGIVIRSPASAAELAPSDSQVLIPYGALIDQLAVPIFAALTGIVAFLIRKLPAAAKSWIDTLRVEQLLDRAIAYGINSVAGAARGKTLAVNVHLPVLAYVLRYALDRMPAALLKWIGGPTSLAEMIWSRLDVDPSAGRPDLDALARSLADGANPRFAAAKAKASAP